ncbi:xanthine dehydrogenase family protein molybdopterin-binding subunit [Pontivivens insulae]|uniref:Isoquinoline 1-oxidoreductase subunit beta n=1 Tax=Pontivivens insulae TaxID=1639689 RepID=A0A2R8AAM1_9RHOB|nr:molybdopterin cofactor-binding domain-containing protein [Pontivivens insulae]RED13182.1 isoquinoline 1-oxidoreductase beta subunit [Pontivivens insulae]SPF29274.1 Isoquinoline 1-oxidoreductase subunit beta [Pontivivens insulae]
MARKKKSLFGKIVRRTFLTAGAVAVGGVAFGAYLVNRDHDNPLVAGEGEGVFNPFVKIATDGTITVITPRAEMGQGIHTTLAAMVAEELDVPLSSITTEHGPTAAAYYNAGMMEEGAFPPAFHSGLGADAQRSLMASMGKVLGLQVTGGSSSVIDGFDKMREAGAEARAALVTAAANRWSVSPDVLQTENGSVIYAAGEQSATYGELVLEAAEVEVEEIPALKSRRDWAVLGKRQMRTDIAEKVTGAPIYGIDVQLPDMLYGTVKISPRFGAAAVSFDDTAARAVPGVLDIVEIETTTGKGFGIIATNTWAAFKGAEALQVEWGDAPYPADDAGITNRLVAAIEAEGTQSLMDRGDVDAAFADPQGTIIEAEYSVPYLAHATMEPMNATAQLTEEGLTIWAGTQAPGIVQSRCAALAGLDKDNVTVNTVFLGGGFGRRGEVDFPLYATALAMQTDGKPIKVTWTREEDTTHDTYRPAAMARMRAVVPEGARADAVEMKVAAPSIIPSVIARTYPNLSAAGPDKTLTDGAYNQPVNYDNFRVSGHAADLSIPVGFWRSVGHSYNCFFHEGFMDEQAEAAGMDPLAYRLAVMEGDDRLDPARGVLNKVAEMSGWRGSVPQGKGRGLAQSLCFGTWIAMVVQVDATDDIRIEKVWAAADPGTVMDPRLFRDQVIGGAIYGFSAALGEEINFEDGQVVQQNFWDYSFMNMEQCPEFEIELLQTSPHIGGAGEVGTPPAVPALANAIYAATGQRLRQMPLSRDVRFLGV